MARIIAYTKLGTPIWEGREDGYILIGDAYLPCGYFLNTEEDLEELNGKDTARKNCIATNG